MVWTALTFSFGSILTSTKMTQLQDNFTALANGDSGSPKIQEAAITGQAAVDRSALKTATVTTIAGNVTTGTTVSVTLNAYAFFPMIHSTHSSTNSLLLKGHGTDQADPDIPALGFFNLFYTGKSGSTESYDIEYRYVQA